MLIDSCGCSIQKTPFVPGSFFNRHTGSIFRRRQPPEQLAYFDAMIKRELGEEARALANEGTA
jgi:hypothetical protein